MAEFYVNDPGTVLATAITSTGATTIDVASSSGYPSTGDFRIAIDDELMLVTGVSGTTWTVTRGIESTSAATHLISTAVNMVLTAASLIRLSQPKVQTDVTGSRSIGTVFQNVTDFPIFVSVVGAGVVNHNFQVFSDASTPPTSLIASQYVTNGFGIQQLFFIVLPGNYYMALYDVAGGSIGLWIEWSA